MKKVLETKVLSISTLSTLVGSFDKNLNLIAEETATLIYTDNNVIKVSGEEENAKLAIAVLEKAGAKII